MNFISYLCIAVTILSACIAASVVIYNRSKLKRTLETMDKMLDKAINGSFNETEFDESMLSAVESKLADYLSATYISSKKIEEEKNRIKELIADISHQTKTPIANILLYSQLLSEQDMPDKSEQCITALTEQADKLSFLINSLVKTSRLEAGVFKLYPKTQKVQALLQEIQKQITPKASQKNIILTVNPTDAVACFDIKWTAEAIYNIADNAVKYTGIGGRININVISYELFCRIDITDNGIGISENEHAKIFTRFYRSPTVNDTEGVGIGLYLAREIIANEGGYIKLSSAKGQGSTFSVFLPTDNSKTN